MVNAMIPPEFPIARGLIEIPKYDAITKRNRTANEATTAFSADTVQNRETAADRIVYSAEKHQNEMKVAIAQQAGAQIRWRGCRRGTSNRRLSTRRDASSPGC
jgi:hypothetical protein